MWGNRGKSAWAAALCAGLAHQALAQDSQPLSAIDWLSRSVSGPAPALPSPVIAPPAAQGVTPSTIVVRPIDGPTLDGLGLIPASRAGLRKDLWGTSPSAEIARLIRAERIDTLPAIQSLLYSLLLAELSPPMDADGSGAVFLARVDKLLDMGALDQALALLEMIDDPAPEVFRRWFDIALLTGNESRACAMMLESPQIAPTFPARIFCLARSGDWNAAALSLRTGEALGFIEPDMAELLARFLDPDLFEGEPDAPMPERPSPLVLRLMEAIGQPIPTTTLPVAFAHADLRPNVGWKSRLEAAERLARTGAIEPARLFAIYAERSPAASGGVWERVRAVQNLSRALDKGDREGVSRALPTAWERMEEIELEVPFAHEFGARLHDLHLSGAPGRLAFRIALLSPEAGRAAQDLPDAATQTDRFLAALADGRPQGIAPPNQIGAAVQAAFASGSPLSDRFVRLIAEGRIGESILLAIDNITDGARGDLRELTQGLTLLRQVGLEQVARRAGIELILLERRG